MFDAMPPSPESRRAALTLPGQRPPPEPEDDPYLVKRLELARRERMLDPTMLPRYVTRDRADESRRAKAQAADVPSDPSGEMWQAVFGPVAE